ncbi:putative mitochondrial protein, partial [Mucuna pruriens]
MIHPTWYPDSGATNHLTSNSTNLMEETNYSDDSKIKMANGASATIQNIDTNQILWKESLTSYNISSTMPVPLADQYTNLIEHVSNQAIPAAINIHPLITRSKVGISKPKVYAAVKDSNLPVDAHTEPQTVKVALSSTHWREAMQQEYDVLLKNKTWSLVPLPPSCKAIGRKWIFKVKRNVDGSINNINQD